MSEWLGQLFEGLLRGAIVVGCAALGWNQLGAADAAGLPHVGFWAIYGGLLALGSVAYTLGVNYRGGEHRANQLERRAGR